MVLAHWLRRLPVLALAVASVPAAAQYAEATQQWAEQALAQLPQDAKGPLRMEVAVGALDSRLRLAPCTQVEPYMPPNTRLWGRTRLGLRCVDGVARWSVFLPVTVKAFGPAWVLRGQVAQGAVLTADDAEQAEVDWAEDRSPVLADPALWVGQITTRSYMPGQAIRQSMVKPPVAFQAGTQVRVVAQGQGFAVSSDAQALSAGVIGQVARVRMESGRILTGMVLDARTVQLDM
ncbi:flagellar basal body P-ring formation chaperone FlgA [Pseudorhodoferax sp. Leaf267]|uniref:flagellar basal body P-ring formation chaperone FlgA n=1 Tax=Pseudorhodoferax sp. Leaf267 TaxID=1736316 RepID=UPI0006F51869|nr:flagellar basal body P-ring formation chaperone FlgA [Pseudorhodoferax sp. Leaf267]KQP13756.1 flagellar biosynthesis protein FlgA [Pseudorhodoferax sp. Leaf267]